MSSSHNSPDDINLLEIAQSLCALAMELEKCVSPSSDIDRTAKYMNRTVRQQIAAYYASSIFDNYSSGQKEKLRRTFLEQNSKVISEELANTPYTKVLASGEKVSITIHDFQRESFIGFILSFVKNSERGML